MKSPGLSAAVVTLFVGLAGVAHAGETRATTVVEAQGGPVYREAGPADGP